MQRKAFDEMYDGSDRVRAHYREFERWLSEQTPDAMQFKRAEADLVFRRVGVTFAVYGENDDKKQRRSYRAPDSV